MTSHPLALLTALALAACSSPALGQASNVSLSQFDGRWFEIARNPNDVQRPCRRAQIDFTPAAQPNQFAVLVTCTRLTDGRVETLRANARVSDTTTNAKFRFSLAGLLSFGGLASQQYWVWDHAPDYSWAIMGLPDQSSWWIWHRSHTPSPAMRSFTLTRAGSLGFDTTGAIQTGQ